MTRQQLPDLVKHAIVRRIARFERPGQVVAAIREEFGLELSPQQVEAYDPTKHAGRELSRKWRIVFEKERATFKGDVSEIPVANEAFRLHSLGRMHRQAEQAGNFHQAAALLEQAAKEVGGMFTNKRRLKQTAAPLVVELRDLAGSDRPMKDRSVRRGGKETVDTLAARDSRPELEEQNLNG